MNILHILFSRGFRGLERYAIDKALAMADRGHDVYFIRRKGTETAKRLEELNFPGEEWNPVKYIDLPAILKIRSLVNRRSFEIVHAHHSTDLGLISPALWRMAGPGLIFSNYMNVPKPKRDFYHFLEYGRVNYVTTLSEGTRLNAIENLPTDQSLRERLSAKARDKVEAKYDKKLAMDKLEKVYKECRL